MWLSFETSLEPTHNPPQGPDDNEAMPMHDYEKCHVDSCDEGFEDLMVSTCCRAWVFAPSYL